MVKDVSGWYTINCQVRKDRRLRGQEKGAPDLQRHGETQSREIQGGAQDSLRPPRGTDRAASPELIIPLLWQDDTDVRVESNGKKKVKR